MVRERSVDRSPDVSAPQLLGWRHGPPRSKSTSKGRFGRRHGDPQQGRSVRQRAAYASCLNSYGEAWSVDGFRTSYFKEIAAAKAAGELRPKRGFHSHRHGVGNALAEAGLSHAEIKTILGNKSAQSVETYIRRANQQRMAAAGVAVMNETLGAEFDDDENE